MKILDGILNKKKIPIYIWIIVLIPSLSFNSAYGAQNIEISSKDQILVTVNLQRILEQMSLVQASLSKGDSTRAFEHAYISHSIIFPSIKDKLREIDKDSAEKLESLLIDLPIMVRSTDSSDIESKIVQIVDLLNAINSNILDPNNLDYNSIISSSLMVLLNDTSKFYHLSDFGNTKDPNNQIDYENAIGMVDISHKLYKNISNSFSDSKKLEIESFFGDLKNSLYQRSDPQSISRVIRAIQTNLIENESNTQSEDSLTIYFGNIKNLLSKINGAIKNNSDYPSAEKYAITAYLDNFEYIEPPLEQADPSLMNSLELMMREELRELIRNKQQSETVALLTSITNNLSRAANLLNVNY
jgi:high-affinity iron transporter